MTKKISSQQYVLGIEGGGTSTTWSLLDQQHKIIASGKTGPGNLNEIGEGGLKKLLKEIYKAVPKAPAVIGLCMAGLHLPNQKATAEKMMKDLWSTAQKVIASEDTKSGFFASHGSDDGIMVISGTGSNTVGKKGDRFEKAGGWGCLLGDKGSAYDVAYLALRAAYAAYDATGKTSPLAQAILRFGGANSLAELVPVIYDTTGKEHVAAYAQVVFQEADKGNAEAKKILQQAADNLAENVYFIHKRMKFTKPNIGLVGSMFTKNPNYVRYFSQAIKKRFNPGRIFVCSVPGAVGAAAFALNTKLEAPPQAKKKI